MLAKEEIIRRLDRPVTVEIYEETGSTNTLAAQHAKEAKDKTPALIIARNQTKGRGTRGRSFFCERGKGLYMTLVCYPDADVKTAHLATPAAGVAVAKALCSVAGVDAQIKWVNDVVIKDKKLCGILAEAKLRSGNKSLEYVIIGIGINLYSAEFPPEIAYSATSLDMYSRAFDENELCAEIVNNLLGYLEALDAAPFMDEYKALSSVIGRCVVFENGGLSMTGRAVDINRQGNLVVDIESSDKRYIITAGDVSVKVSDC